MFECKAGKSNAPRTQKGLGIPQPGIWESMNEIATSTQGAHSGNGKKQHLLRVGKEWKGVDDCFDVRIFVEAVAGQFRVLYLFTAAWLKPGTGCLSRFLSS